MRKWIGLTALLAGLAVLAVPNFPSADAQDKKKEAKKVETKGKEATTGTGTIEIYKDKSGEYRFRIKDSDGKVIAMPPRGYDDKADVLKHLDLIKATLEKVKPTEVKD